jgi:hypothetical protein
MLNGMNGWRLPTQPELSALYASGAMNGQGWTLGVTRSSTPYRVGVDTGHYFVVLSNFGIVNWISDSSRWYVSCVRNNANVAPVADAGSAQGVAAGTLVTLNGRASSDANVDPLSYSWTLTTKPAGSTATLTGATTTAPTFTADLPGTYIATLVVNDGTLGSAAATATITGLTASYVVQGGLNWMPVSFTDNWLNARDYCTNTTINGLTGWRLPTQAELSALQASGAMNGQGWTLGATFSDTTIAIVLFVNLGDGSTGYDWNNHYVSCVR